MTTQYKIGQMSCLCSTVNRKDRITYILYPMDILGGWIEGAAERFDTNIAVITGMDWQNVFSPWPAKGVPAGDPDFKGQSPEFLDLLRSSVIPQIEGKLGLGSAPRRTLVGVSMSGLFALWQWMMCDTFADIASLSGSFWYEGFVDWIKSRPIPSKTGEAYFLLGDRESHSNVKEFNTVGADTREIVNLLKDAGIHTRFDSVAGNHFSDPIPRLNRALEALYLRSQD